LQVQFDIASLEQAYQGNGCTFFGATWDFGDGASSSQNSPLHQYAQGDYLATASGDGECCSQGSCFTMGLNLTDIPIRAY